MLHTVDIYTSVVILETNKPILSFYIRWRQAWHEPQRLESQFGPQGLTLMGDKVRMSRIHINSEVQRQTAVPAYLKSKQLLLLVLIPISVLHFSAKQTAVTAYPLSKLFMLFAFAGRNYMQHHHNTPFKDCRQCPPTSL